MTAGEWSSRACSRSYADPQPTPPGVHDEERIHLRNDFQRQTEAVNVEMDRKRERERERQKETEKETKTEKEN